MVWGEEKDPGGGESWEVIWISFVFVPERGFNMLLVSSLCRVK